MPVQIQRGNIVIANTTNTNTGTISAVTATATSELFNTGHALDAGNFGAARLDLTNTTTVTATRGPTAELALTVAFQVTSWT